ncbi:single-stranded-DNA-specific exonuclease RecJ [Campylobacter volucris]|uniref:Single-stranded-DNA-specific exonuclease RecJ n=1 Tax=Campylobacter volucris TaxID=1031542 RepID=A0AAE5YGP1_9BACT|nr:single-stranded-DNA-specific exonuclease RecJ [Campylobacter volucris]AJC93366.1 single-stranded DNA-specific exonuclease [Campylobacter volucris LMG 24379]KAB0579646.1 single-stranded-DNA-specific exonuclease RecJ [Campylobacter volucris]MBF7043331.1 single-stranded-DNA-specific exonuclease RecJ [Campylobacter volucris]MBF7068499.1 single-stranded-DNA-specific exonuclease RecJ [Campylobacter volucris]QBL12812.1 single-stranded-DNA-specific exonuclease RecJ [Campylobacter volucris]
MLNKAQIKQILHQRFENDIHVKLCDLPMPSCLKDVFKGALRIKEAIEKNQKVAIVGDYDVDGVISCVIFSEFFDDIGFDYIVKIPNRFKDGYGLNEEIINELGSIDLIITVDNGIAAVEAAKMCKEKGIDLIITDHHMPPAILPDAYAIINPKQQDCDFPNVEICGAQVAWYLIGAIKEVCKINYDMCKFIELLAIAIIADMMELRDLNRALVRKGIECINSSNRVAFKAIRKYFGKDKFEIDNISFLIAPLINSAGRMDDAIISYKFLHSKNMDEVMDYLEQIVSYNNNRKDEERELFKQCLEQVDENNSVIIVNGCNWHEGVLGIVASRLAKHFNKPAFVFSQCEDRAKASVRSVGQIDILEVIEKAKELVLSYGGHKGAAGVMVHVDQFELFKNRLNEICAQIPKEDFYSSDEVLGSIDPNEVDFELLEILEFFEPFGHKNPRPYFKFNQLFVKNKKYIGKDEKHIKLILTYDNKTLEALFFNYDYEPNIGENISLIASISKNNFRGLITPQLTIKEIIK